MRLWYLPQLGQEGVIPYTVMLNAVACLLKKQSGNTWSLQVTVLKGNVRISFVCPPFPRQDQFSVKQFSKYAVCASYCIRAGIPETDVFSSVDYVALGCCSSVSAFAHQCSGLFLRTCYQGGIASHCPKAACSVFHALSHQLWTCGDRELQAACGREAAGLVGG